VRAEIAERKLEILALLRRRSSSNRIAAPPIRPRARGAPAPLSFAQERLWFLEQLDPGNTVYTICRASRIIGRLNVSALEASLNQIVCRHELLRSAIRVADDQPVQIVQAPFELKISLTDLQRMSDDEGEQEISNRIQQAADTPFDFSIGRFLKAALLRVGNEKHILILTTHHIVSDAWSLGILTRELWSLYEAYAAGNSCPLRDPQIQYGDFAIWQRESLQGQILVTQISYWKKQLSDPPIVNLPTDRPRPPRQSFHGARVPIQLAKPLSAAINDLSSQCGVTPFMTLLAAFQVLLYRYSGQKDVLIGSPIANRRRSELEPLVGLFVNMLVLRSNLAGNPPFEELLFRVRETCLAAFEHQDLPFEKLVQELQPERDPSRNPMFQVMFALQNATRPFSGISGLQISPVETEVTRSPFDLSLFLRERDGKYIGNIEYSTDIFNRDRIERMTGHFQTLLEAIVADPHQPIVTLPIVTEAERDQILVEWNDAPAAYPKDKCIHHLFEEQVERTPDAIALVFQRQQLTYHELNVRANELAHYLRAHGVAPEMPVGICVERSLDMVIGLLGILKAGGAYLPLDPAYPNERLRFMLEDAQVSVLLTQRKLIDNSGLTNEDGDHRPFIFHPRIHVICLDRDWPLIAQCSSNDPKSNVESENLAYVIYTSGSSGQPKGVKVNHKSAVNLCHTTSFQFRFDSTDVWTGCHSYAFDFSAWEMWGCLLAGGRLVVVPLNLTHSPDEFLELLIRERVTVLNQTPTAIAQLVDRMSPESKLPNWNLRLIICGGEVLSPILASSLLKWRTPLWNFYGPTEATVWATVHHVTSADAKESSVLIGRPLANTQIYVLDAELQLVPAGVPGEICISGVGLAREYLNRPELTAQQFVPNPFENGNRLYRTGDLGRYLPDGSLQFLGRLDDQVKVRGYRVELGEIEAVLNQHPAVNDSVIVTRARESLAETSLIGYIVPKQQPSPSIVELRKYLKEKLPENMIPSAFVMLNTFPIMPNGKIDRKALPPFDDIRPELEGGFVEPRTPLEEMLVGIWREVLKLDSVSVNDNFFELGGHSLLAIQIISRLRDTLAKNVSVHAIFEKSTIAGLASILESTDDRSSRYLPPITRVPRGKPLHLSMNQEHLWHVEQMVPGTHFFNVPYVYRLSGDLNIPDLEKALQGIIRRHEALRTVFGSKNGCPVASIKDTLDLQLPVIDIRNAETDSASEMAADIMLEQRTEPFDLALGPLVRTKLLRLTNTEYLLLVTMHHIITDESSMRVFFKELTSAYSAYSQGRELQLSAPPIQPADFAHWERELLNRGLFERQLNYWRIQLSGGMSELTFKKAVKRTKSKSFRTARVSIELAEGLFDAIRATGKAENTTPFVIVLTALNILLYQYTGQKDIRIGTLMANRGRKESEAVIGYFMNTVVLRNRIDPQLPCRQFVKHVGKSLRSALMNQELPFNHLAQVLKQERGILGANFVPIMFIYHKRSSNVVRLPGISFASVGWHYPGPDTGVMITSCDLVINMWEMTTKIVGAVNYNPDKFDDELLSEMVTQLTTIIKRLVVDTERSISYLNKLPVKPSRHKEVGRQ
jgi:amino acid adenylation domain-containing protein